MPPGSQSTLVLLPGMDGTGELFAPFLNALSPWVKAEVVRFPSRALDYRELKSVVMSALPRDRPYSLLAESFSGPLGISIAADRPIHLDKLVLCCTFAKNPRPSLGRLERLLPLVPVGTCLMALAGRMLMGTHSDAGLDAAFAKATGQVPPSVFRDRIRTVLHVDVTKELERLRVPTLYLQATGDRLVPGAALELLLRRMPDLEVARIEGPHLLLQRNPQQAAHVVEAFIGTRSTKPLGA